MKATIKSVNGNDSVVEFELSDGSKSTQTIANVPLENEEKAADFLNSYLLAYERGKKIEQKQVDQKLINKPLTLTGLVQVEAQAEPIIE